MLDILRICLSHFKMGVGLMITHQRIKTGWRRSSNHFASQSGRSECISCGKNKLIISNLVANK